MSKRFGRNQKRKLKARIGALETSLCYSDRRLKEQRVENRLLMDRLNEIISDFDRWLRNSVLTEPEIINYKGELPLTFRIERTKPIEMQKFIPGDEFVETMKVSLEMLDAFHVVVKKDIGERYCHVILRGPKAVDYYVSENTLKTFGMTNGMKRHIFNQISEKIKETYK